MIKDSENPLFIQPLLNFFEQFHPLSEGFINYHLKTCRYMHVKKNKFILSPMENNNSIYFLVKGLVRGFVKEDQKDISTWFGIDNELIAAIRNPNQHSKPSYEYVQALEDSELISIPYQNIDFLAHFPETNLISRKLLELQYHAAAERAILARVPSAMGRYLKFENTYSNTNRIPLRYLASYLGMRLETLSRIRTKSLQLSNAS
ncbi:Crp/Fnr family transcriptional regulator [Pedobacter aquatilis]|uniref:Crp/Fnr family transcriptional regulator n=1 Tax=Pedobacter aquatilis TaxID=351343 RepID=UPI0025B49854|nr:Crp/Fnr family transcriptional regulator [Pedobacter aquatilis]MDN3585941.1 Crp/Fnr family transcriptional regulator [Pedobacter aquatilis]